HQRSEICRSGGRDIDSTYAKLEAGAEYWYRLHQPEAPVLKLRFLREPGVLPARPAGEAVRGLGCDKLLHLPVKLTGMGELFASCQVRGHPWQTCLESEAS